MLAFNLSPLQYLAANGIAFAAGATAVLVLQWYGQYMHDAAIKQAKATND